VSARSLACALHICIHLPGCRATQPLNNKTPAPLPVLRRVQKLHTQIITPQSLRFFLPPLRIWCLMERECCYANLVFFHRVLLSAGANFNFYRPLLNYAYGKERCNFQQHRNLFRIKTLADELSVSKLCVCVHVVYILFGKREHAAGCVEKKRKMLIPAGKNAK
jgi:hypothetical protein